MEATKDLSAALEAHGEALAAEMQALEDMPQVKLTPASVLMLDLNPCHDRGEACAALTINRD